MSIAIIKLYGYFHSSIRFKLNYKGLFIITYNRALRRNDTAVVPYILMKVQVERGNVDNMGLPLERGNVDNMGLPQRKPQRLKEYDYSQSNAYYITICTQNRKLILGKIESGNMVLSQFGKAVERILLNISTRNDTAIVPYIIVIDKYCIMPNHIHAILNIENNHQDSDITLSDIVKYFKISATKFYIDNVRYGDYEPFNKKVWQKSFYDRMIRNETDYLHISKYIDENVLKWNEDELNTENL